MRQIMFRNLLVSLILFFPILWFLNCEEAPNDTADELKAKIVGYVKNKNTSNPISEVLVKVIEYDESSYTDETGYFEILLDLKAAPHDTITLEIKKDKFLSTKITNIIAESGNITQTETILLSDIRDVLSGDASNIVLTSIETEHIYIKGSGAKETSKLIFEVRDDKGIPVDQNHPTGVKFHIIGTITNGDAFLSPTSDTTNYNGEVSTTINSGTIAGAVQILCEIPNKDIQSIPVPIAIWGGPPDIDHFWVGTEKVNYPYLFLFDAEINVTSLVGDKYSNPVPPGTVVYFKTTDGVIEGEQVTNELGQAVVTFLTGGGEWVTLTAQTQDYNRQPIEKSSTILMSGHPYIIVTTSPLPFVVADGDEQVFNYNVHDCNGNPLSEGNNISVSASKGELYGDINVKIPDTQSKAYTSFSFTLFDDTPGDIVPAERAKVTISVSGPNGYEETSIMGSVD
jgi:hypothetical protein